MSIAGYKNCEDIFRNAERLHRDLMEPWSNRVAVAEDPHERLSIMRQGLAATFRQRYPMPEECWPTDPVSALPPAEAARA
jgi:hypothetical protein